MFENILENKGIHHAREGNSIVYEWKDWVEVEISEKEFFNKVLRNENDLSEKLPRKQ